MPPAGEPDRVLLMGTAVIAVTPVQEWQVYLPAVFRNSP